MADCGDPIAKTAEISFIDFPDDVQLCILSFLPRSDLISFSCTSKLFASLFHTESKIWYALCERRWGSKTEIKRWRNGKVGFKLIYSTLAEYENLIGFWRRSGDFDDSDSSSADPSMLVVFEWGPSSIVGSRVSPSEKGDYNVVKTPYIQISPTPEGEIRVLLEKGSVPIPIALEFVGEVHVFLVSCRDSGINGGSSSLPNSSGEESNGAGIENLIGAEIGSLPDRLVSEMYQVYANRTSPGGERAWRRQRRRERDRRGRRWREPEHLVKIA